MLHGLSMFVRQVTLIARRWPQGICALFGAMGWMHALYVARSIISCHGLHERITSSAARSMHCPFFVLRFCNTSALHPLMLQLGVVSCTTVQHVRTAL